MHEIRKLRGQITNIVQVNCPGANIYLDPKMKPPSSLQVSKWFRFYSFLASHDRYLHSLNFFI